jgi:hypothetical protein
MQANGSEMLRMGPDSPRHLYESYVDADLASEFLMVKRKTILQWARTGTIPAHPFGRGKRVTWRFRLSELAGVNAVPRGTMTDRQS